MLPADHEREMGLLLALLCAATALWLVLGERL